LPGKADREAQTQFLETYDHIRFLPPYAPNLNLIERLWRFFKKRILYNWYYETFVEFRTARETFFKNPHK